MGVRHRIIRKLIKKCVRSLEAARNDDIKKGWFFDAFVINSRIIFAENISVNNPNIIDIAINEYEKNYSPLAVRIARAKALK